jgi:hypothetical protein
MSQLRKEDRIPIPTKTVLKINSIGRNKIAQPQYVVCNVLLITKKLVQLPVAQRAVCFFFFFSSTTTKWVRASVIRVLSMIREPSLFPTLRAMCCPTALLWLRFAACQRMICPPTPLKTVLRMQCGHTQVQDCERAGGVYEIFWCGEGGN